MRNRMGRAQQAHSDSTSNDSGWSLSRPWTKGVATASVAQAPQSRSPLLKASRWGVGSTVTG